MTNKDIIKTLSQKGYGYKKIAKELNISVGSVRNALIETSEAPVCKNCGGKLKFIEGDIEHFEGVNHVDMVITLHACDTATDYALYKAIKWDADVIMAVPCCQHELNRSKGSGKLSAVNKYGLLKERMAAIYTDAMRANLLTQMGYDTQVLEFIDMEHTPKNILIRAVKGKKGMIPEKEVNALKDLEELAGGSITLSKLLKE